MAIDVKARQDITQIKSQLGDHPGGAVIGRRSAYEVGLRDTVVVGSLDTSPDDLYGVDRTKYNTATYQSGYTNSSVVVRVASGEDEFWLQSEHVLDEFTESSLTTATVTSSVTSVLFSGSVAGSDWYSASWLNRNKLTIDNTKVPGDLTNFPVYVNLADITSSTFWSGVDSAGADLRATDSTGTTLVPIEVVSIDTGASTGEVHVKLASVSSGADTDFYLYYNNTGASALASSDANGRDAVWSGYDQVLHLESDYNDSSGNTNATNTGTSFVTGQVGGGADSENGESDYISSNVATPTGDFTFEWWAKPESWGSIANMVAGPSNNNFVAGWDGLAVFDTGSGGVLAVQYVGGKHNTSFTPTATQWFHCAMTVSGTTVSIRVNGSSVLSTTVSGTPNTRNFYWGRNNNFERYFDGVFDELRFVSGEAKSSDWTDASYANQNSSGTFYSVAVAEVEASSSSGGTDYVTKPVFLDGDRAFTKVLLTAPEVRSSSGVDSSLVTYQVSPDQSTWQTITPGVLTSLSSSTSSLYAKMVGVSATACSTDFHDTLGEGTPLRIKLYEG